MKIHHLLKFPVITLFIQLLFQLQAVAWSEHPLLVRPVLKDHPFWATVAPVEVKSLATFLMETAVALEPFLAKHEFWSVSNLPGYVPCPAELAFIPASDPEELLRRFYHAIRLNPEARLPLYLYLFPGEERDGWAEIPLKEVTTLRDTGSMQASSYVRLQEGERVSPFRILCTASDEPDYGFDLGLFDDNGTEYGAKYGFGEQPFGNPNLEYSSQAPFHMGFFHEARILYKFGPFLRKTFIDYRIFLFRALSGFAFENNQPYWGWRFLGWSMHYMGDVSMPYHMRPLPGVSTSRMMWINLKAILGASEAKDKAVQLVSNRHTIFEEFQLQMLREAFLENNQNHPFIKALRTPVNVVPFSLSYVVDVASAESAVSAKAADRALKRNLPYRMVSDPDIEVSHLPELQRLPGVIREEKGQHAADELTKVIAQSMVSFARDIQVLFEDMLPAIKSQE